MVYEFLFITINIFQAFDFEGILQQFEIKNWRIGEFDFLCH